MHTAEIAARRGHRVVLFERAAELGGHLNLLKQFPTRQEWNVAIDNLRRAIENNGVDVRLGVAADADRIAAESPDVVIVATGARWDKDGVSVFKPERDAMPGWEQDNVVDLGTAARRALADPQALGRRVVIWDEAGTYLHLGLADVLAHAGVDVEILTSLDHPGEDALKHFDLFFVMPRLVEAGVRIGNQTVVERIDGNEVYARSIWGGAQRRIDAVDTLVLSMLRSPDDALYRDVRHRYADVRRVGDCLAPRKPVQVMYEAHETARAI
jgi:NADPH-dependent 2,4-dienoyl-CoA reductase/sulfur reductase-like enzyme